MLEKSLQDFIQEMPKAEIHIHLEGAIQPETLLELARRNNMMDTLPADNVAGLREWYTFSDFGHFVKIYLTIADTLRNADDFALIAYHNGKDMAAQNIRYRELTFTPFLHTDYLDKGLTIEPVLAGLKAGKDRAAKEFGVEMRWVFDIPRDFCFPNHDGKDYDPYAAEATLKYALAGREIGVVGYGLGGSEPGHPPEPFADAFVAAKVEGLMSVPHAGETEGPESVWGSLRELQAQRIGHGVRAIEDQALMAYLKEHQIPLEINPTSNICLHVYDSYDEHPFRKLDEYGIPVTVNSDDPPLFNTSLVEEYAVLAEHFGYGRVELVRIARNAFVYAGMDQATKTRLLAEFDQWVEANL